MSLSSLHGYVEAQSRRSSEHPAMELPFVTISREAGAGAVTIGRLVAEHLNRSRQSSDEPPWTVFDKNLVERVLEDHELPAKLKEFLPEDTTFDLKDALEEMLGLHPSSWSLIQHTADTILRLASLGNVILVGRGSNIITAYLPRGFHVRLVSPLHVRIAHAAKYYEMSPAKADEFVHKTDRARRRYVKRHFSADIDDPLQYDLTINTGRTGFETAAHFIGEAVVRSLA